MDLDLYNATYEAFLDLLGPAKAFVLDVGCGPGNIAKYLLMKNPELKLKGIDVAENMIKLARKNNPSARFEVLDCRKIDLVSEKFDGVIAGFCLPYLSRPACSKFIKDCDSLLNTGGIIYLSFVEGEYKNSGFIKGSTGDRMYFYYHDLEFLEKELKNHHFETKVYQVIPFEKTEGTRETHTILIAKK